MHFGPKGYETGIFTILVGLKNLGHIVETCDVTSAENVEIEAQKSIDEFKPDIAITIGGWHARFDAKALWKVLKRNSIPSIYHAIEDPTFFDWVSCIYINDYDFVFTVSEAMVSEYEKRGVAAKYLSYSCNPDFHKRVSSDERFINDIIVLSNKYVEYDPIKCAFRNKCYEDLIKPLIDGDYDLKIYGNGWDDEKLSIKKKFLGGTVFPNIVPKVYSSAKMVLIVQWDETGHICSKTYEAFGCRCLQIAPYTPLQEKYFKQGEHIIYSRSPEDTIKYVDYYLSHEKEREEIAARGQIEAYKNHSCDVRAREFLETLKKFGYGVDFISKNY